MIKIVCIVGPTASGKSARAVAVAKERDGEVISVDSRQVYRMLDIGSEKMSAEEMVGIPHYLIDIRDPKDVYTAHDFVQDATRLIDEISSRGKLPILVGGTHFYFDALLNGLPTDTAPNPKLREELETKTTEELYTQIQTRDPRRAAELDPKNRRRLIRALEIIEAHGSVPERTVAQKYDVEWMPIFLDRDELRTRIAEREALKFPRGLIEEVRKVREYVGDERLNELGLEYRVVGEYLRGERDEASILPALKSQLFQYARRQEAWLRKLRMSNAPSETSGPDHSQANS
ncbi:MAG TPA: tRNA (adenosine(37)-N6)-dimethylallyltransferase MiaA [Candidatus Paceibacterota bacterium]|nr:tRNA (adenosine(37)-N6)-dimethylallyltransferase MiaA [Candidatus Paceibacterota bacterium]